MSSDMSSLEQRLSRIEEKLKQENMEARRRIDLNIEMSPQRSRPRPTLQLPLANDGGSRSSSSENSPQHNSHPSRPRHMLTLPTPPYCLPKSLENAEIDQKLQEIMKQTGYLKIDGQQMRRTGNKDENKRILMDLDVVLKSHDCPYIIQCYGAIVTNHGVIHRDVKPSNILIDAKGQIKLCDFGISGRLVDSKAKTRSAGCAAYMAPERIDPPDPTKPDYDIRADVWSLGISLVELATGQFPYKNCKTDFEVLTKVLQEDPPLLPTGMGFSLDFQSFVKDCTSAQCKNPFLCLDQCRQSPVGALHPVQGLLETYRAGLGCATQGKHGHKVHVINLRRTSLDRAKQVTLHLRPISMLSVHRRPLIFVLRSKHALGWRVEAERLEPGVRHLFHVSEGSAVQSPLENFTLSLLSEKSLPSRSDRLLRWTLRKYRTVTSFTEFDQVNHIYIRIGEDPMMPSSCVLKKLFLSQNYLASDLQPQEVTGCVTPGLEMDPEVHLVHLRSAGSNLSGSLQVDVMVTLQPPDALLTVWSDVILLLKCDASVNWVIKPRGVRGRLRVYGSMERPHSVDYTAI
ncbi:UNVERIFIED_CONTAM: hypothetical protein FKN15_029498 [Acipenser sinensis]